MASVLLSNLWPHEAATWFLLLETHFSYITVANQSTRFPILTPYLTKGVAAKVSDVLIRPSAEARGDDMKNALLRRCHPSKERRVTKLLPRQPVVSCHRHPFMRRPTAAPKKNKQFSQRSNSSLCLRWGSGIYVCR